MDEDLKRYPNVERIDVKRYAALLMEYERSATY